MSVSHINIIQECMAHKRTSQEAFGAERKQVSAFAAAKLVKNYKDQAPAPSTRTHDANAEEEYDHDGTIPQLRTQSAVVDTVTSALPAVSPQTLQYSTSTIKLVEGSSASASINYALGAHDGVLIVGEYDIEVIDGAVSISGALLRRSSGRHRVFAPSTHALPRIISRTSHTIIRLTSVESRLDKLEALSPLFRNIWTARSDERSFTVLFNSTSDILQRSLVAVEDSHDTERVMSQLCIKAEDTRGGSSLSIICIGPKSAGKSTVSRTICNALLTRSPAKRCLFLDIDPGQPEFGPPGQVYLVEVSEPILGPSYTHFATRYCKKYRLICAHTLAATSFRDSPHQYLACIGHLFRHELEAQARKRAGCPVVINTSGWIHGLGLKMLQDVLAMEITDAILVNVGDQVLTSMVQTKVKACYNIDRALIRPTNRTSAELRQMHMLSYFHNHPSRSTGSQTDPAQSIGLWRPWVLAYDGEDPVIAAVISYGQAFNTKFLTEVLDGTVVAIVAPKIDGQIQDRDLVPALDESLAGMLHKTAHGIHHVHLSDGLDPQRYEFYGLGIVRGINVQAGTIHLITPLPEAEMIQLMKQSLLLVRGGFDTPDWAYLEPFHIEMDAQMQCDAPWVSKQEMIGVEGAIWRLRHPPTVSQINGKR